MNRRHGVAVPWLAELLFRIVTPARERGFLLGDLAEEFTKRVARGEGVEEVKRWYWRQLRGSGLPGLRRLRNPRHKDRTPRRRRHLGDQVNLMVDDMRYAVRVLRRHLGFAAMAVIVMAIGVGSTTTVFSVVESTLLRPLPFPDPDRLVMPVPVRAETGRGRGQVSYGDYEDWSREEVFASSAVFMPTSADLSGLGEPVRVAGLVITEHFFANDRCAPRLGAPSCSRSVPVRRSAGSGVERWLVANTFRWGAGGGGTDGAALWEVCRDRRSDACGDGRVPLVVLGPACVV